LPAGNRYIGGTIRSSKSKIICLGVGLCLVVSRLLVGRFLILCGLLLRELLGSLRVRLAG